MQRRTFLQQSGLGLLASTLPSWVLCQSSSLKFGIQVYSVKEDMEKDPIATLRNLAAYGYQQIESFEGSKGIFWGMQPKEMKQLMNDLGMELIASHCNYTDNLAQKAEAAASIGMKYLICPWIGPQKSLSEYQKIAQQFQEAGKICAKAGIRFAYHNHAYSFEAIDGQLPQDILMKETDPALVDFELDMYWSETAGVDTAAWLKKYSGRFRLCHIKDRSKQGNGPNASCNLGEGKINYQNLLRVAKNNGMEYFLVEQEKFDGSTPMKSAAANARYMQQIKL
jgi:sugar phosphate isomerase/epimerase